MAGYWAQRKKRSRTKLFLEIAIGLLVVSFLINFMSNGFLSYKIEALRFHIFITIVFLVIYSFIKKFWSYGLILTIFSIICYFTLAHNGGIFSKPKLEGENNISYDYLLKEKMGKLKVLEEKVIARGTFSLDDKYDIHYILGDLDSGVYMFINVSFEDLKYEEANDVMKNLSDFVNMQDNPVVVVGNFGVPVWSNIFSKFLEETSLEVKNKVILTTANWTFAPFSVPEINVVGFKGMSLERYKNIKTKDSRRLSFKLSF